jgi:hypothetical protein
MLGISGIARSGKDTLALAIKDFIEKDLNKEVRLYSLAKRLKEDCDAFLIKNLEISAFTQETLEKTCVRPFLVGYGDSMKLKFGKDIWCKKLEGQIVEDISSDSIFPVVTDVRFDYEVDWIRNKFGGAIIHVTKNGNYPPNEAERINDPIVQSMADIKHFWPHFEKNVVENAKDHAIIMWQMVMEAYKEKWTT